MALNRESTVVVPGRMRLAPGLLPIELALIVAIFWADAQGYVPLSKTPFLLIVAWGSMWLRGVRWRDIGFCLPKGWPRLAAIGAVVGGLMWLLEFFVTQPLIHRVLGIWPDLSGLQSVVGNVKMLLIYLGLSWVIAAIGEELTWRGYLMQRAAQFFGDRPLAWSIALVITSVGFGLFHLDQGPSGVIQATVAGVLLAVLYLATGRNLIAPIIAHGVSNSVDFILIFFGVYPGFDR